MTTTTPTERPIYCVLCEDSHDHHNNPLDLVESTLGLVCRRCKVEIIGAELALAHTPLIRHPQHAETIPNN